MRLSAISVLRQSAAMTRQENDPDQGLCLLTRSDKKTVCIGHLCLLFQPADARRADPDRRLLPGPGILFLHAAAPEFPEAVPEKIL